MKRAAFDEARDMAVAATVAPNYSCKAHGCPNAGTMERGVCFFHWRAEPTAWAEVTHHIRSNWPEMANWGEQKTKLEAEKAAKRRAERKDIRPPRGLVTEQPWVEEIGEAA